MAKIIPIEEAVKLIPDGASVMFGGFLGCGSAHKFIDALSKSGVKDLTIIANDGSIPGGPLGEDFYGIAKNREHLIRAAKLFDVGTGGLIKIDLLLDRGDVGTAGFGKKAG